MSRLLTVCAKEVKDNFRDRRTLLSALVFGPLFGPVLFLGIMTLSLDQAISDSGKPLDLAIAGADRAPNLVDFLAQNNVEPEELAMDREAAMAAVKAGEHDQILYIPELYGEQFRGGIPARVELIIDESNNRATGDVRRARGLVRAWGQQIGTLRLQVRGIDPAITRAVQLQEIDVSTPTGRSAILLGMMSYFLIFSMLMGGMYLAIDTTAGERERGSLEPLLTLPVQRSTLIGGKILATCFYMSMSLAAALIAFSVSLQFLPLEKVGMTANFGPGVVASAFLILVPFTLLGASLMTVVASFTKSYKEAQSYMTVVLLLPTLPIMIAALLTVRPTLQWMAVPSLSQHLLVTDLIKDEALSPLFVATSVGSTLAVGIALTWLAMRLYHREGILG
jgi:sodium transport system permease protein